MNTLLGRNILPTLPNADSPSSLASSFLNYFNDKIVKLCSSIPACTTPDAEDDSTSIEPPQLCAFDPATTDEIRSLILSSTDSSCCLVPIPSKLLKSCVDVLTAPITNLVNRSLSEWIFPDVFKNAVVSPLLKKHSLPKEELSSYRPISNLNFVSKTLEKVISSRLSAHFESFPSLSPYLSAYRKFHSTETALTRIHNDLLVAMNRRQVSALVLLDLSAAFDTLDHQILLKRLKMRFSISEVAHSLLSSYLSNRCQSVLVSQERSPDLPLQIGRASCRERV